MKDLAVRAIRAVDGRALARSAGIAPSFVTYRVLDENLFGLRPYSLITIRPGSPAPT